MRPNILPDLISEVNLMFDSCKINIIALRESLRSFERNPPTRLKNFFHAQYLRCLSLALMTGILLSRIRNSLIDEPLQFSSESSQWSHEILSLAKIAVKFQPLGSAALIFALQIAWIGTPSRTLRDDIKASLVNYETVCLGHCSTVNLAATLESIEKRYTLIR